MQVNTLNAGYLKTKEKQTDSYKLVIFCLVSGFLCVIPNLGFNVTILLFCSLTILLSILIQVYVFTEGYKIIQNNFNQEIVVLTKYGELKKLLPYEIPTSKIEALSIKGIDGIYKASRGVKLIITNDGVIHEKSSFTSLMYIFSDKGLKDKEWIVQQNNSKLIELYQLTQNRK